MSTPQFTGALGTGRDFISYASSAAAMVKNKTSFLNFLMQKDGFFGDLSRAVQHQFWDDVLAPRTTTITTAANDSVTNIELASTSGIAVGTRLQAVGSAEVMRVTVVVDGTNVTVVRNATLAEAIADNTVIKILSFHQKEGADGHTSAANAGDARNNEFSLFREVYSISATRGLTLTNDGKDPLAAERETAINTIIRAIQSDLVYGSKVALTGTTPGSMAGMAMQITAAAAGSRRNVAGTLDEDVINTSCLNIINNGGIPDTILLNPSRLDAISASAVARFLQANDLATLQAGYSVSNFVSKYANAENMGPLRIVADSNVDPAHAFVFDSAQLKLIPKRWFAETSSPTAKDTFEGLEYAMATECTLEMKSAGLTAEFLYGITG